MARISQLYPTGTPGRVYSFTAKSAGGIDAEVTPTRCEAEARVGSVNVIGRYGPLAGKYEWWPRLKDRLPWTTKTQPTKQPRSEPAKPRPEPLVPSIAIVSRSARVSVAGVRAGASVGEVSVQAGASVAVGGVYAYAHTAEEIYAIPLPSTAEDDLMVLVMLALDK